MTSSEIRNRFLEFFKKRGHTVIPSASLVTSDEKGVTDATLFNTAGMQPLISYLLGRPYLIEGREIKRLANAQKCLRTVDIDDVGDKTHATFFEMLGNWSLGDYFKKEAIEWSYEFLTNPQDGPDGDRGLGLDPSRLYVTVFDGSTSSPREGDANVPRDDEAAEIWRGIFKKNSVESSDGDTLNGEAGRIFYMPAANNWWEAGENGPCGPDTEMYYDIGDPKTGKPFFGGKGITKEQFLEADAKREVVEVWNDVFMQYEKKDSKVIGKLPKPSVDTGAGLERLAMTLQGVDNIYDTDLFKPVMGKIKELSKNWNEKSARIVADHIRAVVFLIADGVIPSNTDRGYVLRKLIRRAITHSDLLKLNTAARLETTIGPLTVITEIIQQIYKTTYISVYPDEKDKTGRDYISRTIRDEEIKSRDSFAVGKKEFDKIWTSKGLSGIEIFTLNTSCGLPFELIAEWLREKDTPASAESIQGYWSKIKEHQELSRAGAERKFKGGMADANDTMVVRYHTATHLLHQALHDVLGESVMQKGSNITPERLRFDFTHNAKMTDEEKKKVEEIVNEKISATLPVSQVIMSKEEAEKTGAHHFFGEKYGDQVSVYFIGQIPNSQASINQKLTPPSVADLKDAYSKEFCGGPHVANTKELAGPKGKWRFKIIKEEAVARGVRRIKAVLQS